MPKMVHVSSQKDMIGVYENSCLACKFNAIEKKSLILYWMTHVLENICDVFLSSAENSFGLLFDRKVQTTKQPTWYGPECKIMRKRWHNAKYRYKLNKTDTNKTTLKQNSKAYEPRCEKTGLRGFRPGPTQTRLYNHRRWLEA